MAAELAFTSVSQVDYALSDGDKQEKQMTEMRMVFVTAPDQAVALALIRTLLDERLIACGNMLPGMRSVYRWKDELCDEAEVQLVLKTTGDCWPALRDRIVAIHPYDCPEVLCIPVKAGHPEYLKWVSDQVMAVK